MAVPKKKTSKSRRNMRRGSNGTYTFKKANPSIDSRTGELKLSHHMSADGFYNGKRILPEKKKKEEEAPVAQA